MMIDYGGMENRAFTIGINETIGYTSIAIFNVITSEMIDETEKNYQTDPYWMVLGLIIFCLFATTFLLKDTQELVRADYRKTVKANPELKYSKEMETASIMWPN